MANRLDRTDGAALPAWMADAVARLGEVQGRTIGDVRRDDGHSNDIWELDLDDGRVLLLKCGRHAWARTFFAASCEAARLIEQQSDIVAPRPLPVPEPDGDHPIQAYWRIPLPTLQQLWPRLDDGARERVLRSWATLLHRLHRIAPPSHGALPAREPCTFGTALHRELHDRLLPAVYTHWPAGLPHLERLIAQAPLVAARRAGAPPALVHNDMHMGNVLCRVDAGGVVHCVGLLDLDDAIGAPPESDFASFHVLHGPLFERPLARRWHRTLRATYDAPLDDALVAFFRCTHLVNQGFSSALLGHCEHAEAIAAELRGRMRALPPLLDA